MTAGNYANVENIFRRCLLTCPNMDLWRCYLTYIRLIKDGKPDERESVLRAFEFAIEHMGMDLNATHIWRDYIQYAKAGPKPANQFEESQKVATVRRLYQRAIESPISNLESLWKEYDAFESGVNKLLAKPLIAEYAGKYMTARAVCHERRGYVDGLQLNMLPVPPTHTPQEAHQVRLWRRLINFEYATRHRTRHRTRM
jgi:cleavage stimulation factor subunit 3